MAFPNGGMLCFFLMTSLHACLSLGTILILLSHPPALRVVIISRMLHLDSMWPGLYVFSHNIYISLLTALCLYNLSSHALDVVVLANTKTPDALLDLLAISMREVL